MIILKLLQLSKMRPAPNLVITLPCIRFLIPFHVFNSQIFPVSCNGHYTWSHIALQGLESCLWPRLQLAVNLYLLALLGPSTPPYADLIWEESFRLGQVSPLSYIQSSAFFFITYEYYDPHAHTGIKHSRQWQAFAHALYTHWIINICNCSEPFPCCSVKQRIYTFNNIYFQFWNKTSIAYNSLFK